MPFPPPQEQRIPIAQAGAMTRRYRDSAPGAPVRACLFPRAAFEAILDQPGCHGIRLYYARTDKAALTVVMIGVDADGRDMQTSEVYENGFPCPPFCDPDDTTLNG